jgi:hypothetical protein
VNATTLGTATPSVSAAEDVVSAGTTVVAVFAPVLILVLLVLGGCGIWRLSRRRAA